MPALLPLTSPAHSVIAMAGLELAGIAGYAVLVVVVLRVAVRWAERAVRAESAESVAGSVAAGETPGAPTPRARP